MKKILSAFLIGLIAGAILLFFVEKKWPINTLFRTSTGKSVADIISDDQRFSSVTSKLEKGGDLFIYLNTEKITAAIEKSLSALKDSIVSSENIRESRQKETEKWFAFMNSLLKDSGLLEISALGVSSKEIEEGMTRSRFVVHHNPGNSNGLIWNLTNNKPGDLDFTNILPEDTVFTSFSDFNYSGFWKWIRNQAESSGDDKIRFGIGSVEKDLKNMGIDLTALLDSINGNSGFVITLDRKKNWKSPAGDKTLEFPEPAIALIFETGDDSIFKLLSTKIPDAMIKDEKGKQTITIKAPPMPFTFSPVIIQSNNLLILASTTDLADKLLNSNESSSLNNSPEFKTLSAGIPNSGNGFTFMSASLFREIMKIQKGLNPDKSKANFEGMGFMKKLGLDFDNLAMFRVTARTDEGFVVTTNSTLKTEMLMMLPVVTVGGIVAAIAIPKAIKMKGEMVNPEARSLTPPSREL